MDYIPLYIQSEYSMLHSLVAIKDVVARAKKEGLFSLAIADGNMHGAIKFYQACKEVNIKPILGLRLQTQIIKSPTGLLLYAKSNVGYQNLLKLATTAALNGVVDANHLRKHSFDLIAVLPSDENEIIKAMKANQLQFVSHAFSLYKELFSELYVGLDTQTEEARNNLQVYLDILKKENVNAVAIHKTNYIDESDLQAYATLQAVDLGQTIYPTTEKENASFFLGLEEALHRFAGYQELLANTKKIADQCHVEIQFGRYRLPSFGILRAEEYFTTLCKAGLNKRLANRQVVTKKYTSRLLYEIDVICKMGFSDYFLIVYDYVKYAKSQGILVGPGRGSAPGSLVSYCLGITDIDPIEFDLLFERFLNPERISMPDIDVDFPDDRRDEVIRYIGSRFGLERVSHITTFGTFGVRMALRDVGRVLNISDDKMSFVMRLIPSTPQKSLQVLIEETAQLAQLANEDFEIAKLFQIASRFEGLPRHTSTHAAGIIMADRELVEYTALSKGMNGLFQTQYEAEDLEKLGLVKMDILGLKNLTIIQKVLTQIEKDQGFALDLLKIPFNDARVFELIRSADTDGVFQLESAGMKKTLVNLKTSSFMDIVHANALYRPGPMEMIPVFIHNKFSGQVEYLHPDLKQILQPTYGIIVFQEQIMLIAQKFAGYSLGQSDILRRAVSKKNAKVLENERYRFVESSQKMGYSNQLASEVYDYIVKFANYGFNKNHSVAYSVIAYQMAYLKTYYYTYFMGVLMSNFIGNASLIQNYIRDCRFRNVQVELPHILKSETDFVVYEGALYYPLSGIIGVGPTIVSQIVGLREQKTFISYEDFVFRTSSFLNKKVVSNLVHAGALDCFGLTRKQLVDSFDETKDKKIYSQFLGNKIIETAREYEEYSYEEISRLEKEALGMNLKYNMFTQYAWLYEKKSLLRLNQLQAGMRCKTLFILSKVREIQTKKQETMAFVEMVDDTMKIDGVVFPQAYRTLKEKLKVGEILIGEGRADLREGRSQVILENVYKVV